VNERGPRAEGPVAAAIAPGLLLAAKVGASGSNLQLTNPLVWVMLGISIAGAIVTFGYLVYAVWKFRDPTKRGRRYG
jgi:hypothetical protein